ncbi:MAG: amino acid permease [Simkaniaceae bacterium]|nr:amino acid permease [Simkaniaceae bacterium]
MRAKSRKLGFWTLTALVVGNIVGSGVFLLPSSLAEIGSITVLSWIVTSVGSILLALVFSKLSILFPKTGGPYAFCREGYGDFIGFQVAYNYWISMCVGNAAVAVACVGYLTPFFPSLAESSFLAFVVMTALIWIFAWINCVGVHTAGVVQLFVTIVKFIPLALVVLVGIFFVKLENLTAFNVSGAPPFTALSRGAMLTLWAFVGLESASIPADEVRNPEKLIPKATVLGTSLSALLYIVCTVVIMGVVPVASLAKSNAPFADMASVMFGNAGRFLVAVLAILSSLGTLNGWTLLLGQVPMAAARDRLFPSRFGRLSKNRAPVFGIVVSSLLATVLVLLSSTKELVDQFTFVVELATLAAILAYVYSCIVEFVVYAHHPEKARKKKLTPSLTVAALAFLYSFWMIAASGQKIVFYGCLLMFTSIPVYGGMQFAKYREGVATRG